MTEVDGFCVRRLFPSWTWWYRSLDMGMAVAYGAEEASQCHHLERTDSAQRNCPSWEKTLPGAWQVPVLHEINLCDLLESSPVHKDTPI